MDEEIMIILDIFPQTVQVKNCCWYVPINEYYVKMLKWHSFCHLVARWVRSSAVTAESLKQRIYADNWHLTALNIFPCALIFLYAETGEKAKRRTRHIWQPICTLWFLTAKSRTRFRVRETAFSDFSVCGLNVIAKNSVKSLKID